jgi:hypothetical protein
MDWIRRHLTYANVMATLAVPLALGGYAVGATAVNGPELKLTSVHRDFDIPPNKTLKQRVDCAGDRVPVSGGFAIPYSDRIPDVAVGASLPQPEKGELDGKVLGWAVHADNRTSREREARMWAVCAEIR